MVGVYWYRMCQFELRREGQGMQIDLLGKAKGEIFRQVCGRVIVTPNLREFSEELLLLSHANNTDVSFACWLLALAYWSLHHDTFVTYFALYVVLDFGWGLDQSIWFGRAKCANNTLCISTRL